MAKIIFKRTDGTEVPEDPEKKPKTNEYAAKMRAKTEETLHLNRLIEHYQSEMYDQGIMVMNMQSKIRSLELRNRYLLGTTVLGAVCSLLGVVL